MDRSFVCLGLPPAAAHAMTVSPQEGPASWTLKLLCSLYVSFVQSGLESRLKVLFGGPYQGSFLMTEKPPGLFTSKPCADHCDYRRVTRLKP